jgi:hypothetical protein
VCIYCNYKEQSRQTVSSLVTSLLRQLVQDHSTVYNKVKTLYKNHENRGTRPAFQQFLEALQSAMGTFSKVFIVVDALDECSDRTRAELLLALRSLGSTVSLLVTSRNLTSIAQDFQRAKHLDIQASDQDVRNYIEGRMPLEPSLQIHVHNDPTLREEIVESITKNVQGMLVSHT